MTRMLSRRNFIEWTAFGFAFSTSLPAVAAPERRTFEISLNELSLRRSIDNGTVDHLDVAKLARQEFGIMAVEYASRFFRDKVANEKYLAEMNRRAASEEVRQILIVVESEERIGDAYPATRRQAVEKHHKWIDAARTLGCHSIQVNPIGTGKPHDQMKQSAEALSAMCDYAEARTINILVENSADPATDPRWIIELLKAVDRPCCRAAPRFDGFDQSDRYKGMAKLAPLAKAVTAVTYEFDERGNETHTDFFRMVKSILDAGYSGYFGIQYMGELLNEPSGIRATKALLERAREQSQ